MKIEQESKNKESQNKKDKRILQECIDDLVLKVDNLEKNKEKQLDFVNDKEIII